MKNPWIIAGVAAAVLFAGAFWYAGVAAEKNNEGVVLTEQVKGNAESTVTLVKYSDFQCPACASFLPAIDEVMALYGDNLRFEYKHFPLPIHRNAVDAAVAAEAAGQQGKFFEFHDALFANQQEWGVSPNPRALFLTYAEALELDMDTFRRHLNAPVLRDRVQTQFTEARDLGLTGTPTFFLNGERMQINTFQDFIDQVGAAVSGPATDATTTPAATGDIRFGI